MSLDIHQNIKERLKYFYSIHKIPNIIFNGSSGSGKSTIVNEFISLIYEGNKEKIKSDKKSKPKVKSNKRRDEV